MRVTDLYPVRPRSRNPWLLIKWWFKLQRVKHSLHVWGRTFEAWFNFPGENGQPDRHVMATIVLQPLWTFAHLRGAPSSPFKYYLNGREAPRSEMHDRVWSYCLVMQGKPLHVPQPHH